MHRLVDCGVHPAGFERQGCDDLSVLKGPCFADRAKACQTKSSRYQHRYWKRGSVSRAPPMGCTDSVTDGKLGSRLLGGMAAPESSGWY
eukprot:1892388-Prymnesium_polylepis.1